MSEAGRQPHDQTAERELLEPLIDGLRVLIQSRTDGDRELAEDLTQQTLELVLTKYRSGEIRELSKVTHFARGVATRLISAHFRRRREELHEALAEKECEISNPERTLDAWGRLQAVVKAISQLSVDRDRELLTRYYLESQRKPAICEEMGLTPDDFDRTLYRAKKRMRERLARLAAPRNLRRQL